MDKLILEDITNIFRILFSAPIMYVVVILYIRLFGKRTSSKMNSFDWIVTVAMGSIVASTVILKGVPLLAGISGILILIILQFIITKLSTQFVWLRNLVQSTPQLLLFEGQFLEDIMRKERVTKTEVLAAIRESGLPNVKQVYAVVLETNAHLSVISMDESDTAFSLADVEGLPEGLKNELQEIRDQKN